MKLRTLLTIAIFATALPALRSANVVTYQYKGNFFTRCSNGTCPADYTSDYIVASVTFSGPLGNSLPLASQLSSVTVWTIQDALGYFHFSSTDTNAAAELVNLSGKPADMSFSTDGNGGIVDYVVNAQNPLAVAIIINPTFTGGSGLQIADTMLINTGTSTGWTAANSTPGQWSVAQTGPACLPGQFVQGNFCAITTTLGWNTAGQGTQSIFSIYVPPSVSGPVIFHVTAITSSLGTAYTGYLGAKVVNTGQPPHIVALDDIKAGAPGDINAVFPGQGFQTVISEVCWDPTCTSAAPPGAVPTMFSMQFIELTPFSADLARTAPPQMTIQFLNGSQVTREETESARAGGAINSYIPGINIGATPAGRYVLAGTAYTQPFDAISVTNQGTAAINGTVTLQDFSGNTVATAPLPDIPAGGAAGYLVIGRSPGDTLGLLPSSTVLPAGSDGIFHGTLVVKMNGPNIVLAQEYNGNAMLNLLVLH
jgi:hypothetical protein